MPLLDRLKPIFWENEPESEPYRGMFNYRRIWLLVILILAVVALVPLLAMVLIDYNVTRHSVMSENRLRVSRATSNARGTLTHFLDERKFALEFIVQMEEYSDLRDSARLGELLKGLQQNFRGFEDLSLLKSDGSVVEHVGPGARSNHSLSREECLRGLAKGVCISEVFRGNRDAPHMSMAVRCPGNGEGEDCILHATLDMEKFYQVLSSLDRPDDGDAFVVNKEGTLQTPTRRHGDVFDKVNITIPPPSAEIQISESSSSSGGGMIVGHASIADSPFILMVVKPTAELMETWEAVRLDLVWVLAGSITLIMIVIVGVATYMVNKIYIADHTRVGTLHQMEHTNRMASIGRLAAGVAHEINNPLAIINQKAGLMIDLMELTDRYEDDIKLRGLAGSILASVQRAGTITKRLLSFARHIDLDYEMIRFEILVREVIGFLNKEAEYRSISIDMSIPDDLPEFESDRGKLQQIFLNLVNNSFQAMNDGGHLSISAGLAADNSMQFSVTDDGCGISKADRKHIFDPFFSTRKASEGTGLGLSITYGLIKELGGNMSVESEVGVGTTFTIVLPLHPPKAERPAQVE